MIIFIPFLFPQERAVLRRVAPPQVPTQAGQPLYTNGDPAPAQQRLSMPPPQPAPKPAAAARPMSTLPPNQQPPQYHDDNANKSLSLDRNKNPSGQSQQKEDKKKHSVFGGLFKKDKTKKKDK